MKNKIMAYISSHYTKGNAMKNIRNQMDIANFLKKINYIPLIPLLLPFFELAYPDFEESELLEWELEWLARCDILIRVKFKDADGIEIPSKGADIEVSTAKKLRIPVFEFDSVELMEKYFKDKIMKSIFIEK